MAITVTYSGTQKALSTVTVTVAGLAISTAYDIKITNPDGSIQTKIFTSDGSGGAVITFVPQVNGSHTVALVLRQATQSISSGSTFQCGGH